jgi:hypothetical protein
MVDTQAGCHSINMKQKLEIKGKWFLFWSAMNLLESPAFHHSHNYKMDVQHFSVYIEFDGKATNLNLTPAQGGGVIFQP